MWRRSRCAAHWGPFLAPSMVRREASVWGSVSGPLMSSHARFGLAVPNPALTSDKFDVACRRSSVPVTTPRSVTRTLPRHIAESPNFSPPPPPAIVVSATFRSLARLMDARAGSELASTASPLGVLSTVTVNVYPKRSTLGACVLFCFFGCRFGYRIPALPCAGMDAPRCTGRRTAAIAESSDCSSHPAPT
jgi:hypothetical protein